MYLVIVIWIFRGFFLTMAFYLFRIFEGSVVYKWYILLYYEFRFRFNDGSYGYYTVFVFLKESLVFCIWLLKGFRF